MGLKGREIVKDADEIIELMNKAFADEWLAYYQYWIGAKIVAGPMKEAAVAELTEHAADELRHADMLAARIIQLGGTPITKPEAWYEMTNCGYEAPDDPFVKTIIDQNIKGEQCAIGVYSRLLEKTDGRDPITNDIVLQILEDEVEHEDDLQKLANDLDLMMRRA